MLVVTEWRQFRSPDFVRLRKSMRTPVLFDGRNLYEPQAVATLGFEYLGIGRGSTGPLPAAAVDAGVNALAA
ncbi:MAG: hypothetical protein LH480_14605 [Rubrivivax sp.]|nr:hypothetical protein [Rubrivivax sp.]